MEQVPDFFERNGLRRLPEEVQRWSDTVFAEWQRVAQEGAFPKDWILGFGRRPEDPDAVTVFVTPGFDVSDKEQFPDELGGERIVYERLEYPEV
jgi:hypothetical protein